MTGRAIPILYEDARSEIKQFGLHELIVACVADQWSCERWELRGRFEAIPKKGDAKLLAACEGEVPNMPHPRIFAVFDADKLHRRLFPSGRPPPEQLRAELCRRCPDERLEVFLLVENTESVVDAAADCLREPRPNKDRLLRDRLLNRAANGSRQIRDCVREAIPSFDACVKRIAELSRPTQSSVPTRDGDAGPRES